VVKAEVLMPVKVWRPPINLFLSGYYGIEMVALNGAGSSESFLRICAAASRRSMRASGCMVAASAQKGAHCGKLL
jgi:hypothetical protein